MLREYERIVVTFNIQE